MSRGPFCSTNLFQNDTTVSADLEQGDVQMISAESMPFQSPSQQWWKSYFGLMIDRAWSCAKGAVQPIWSDFKSKFQDGKGASVRVLVEYGNQPEL
jgi:hypothetical protein